jgi:hypothetical protein
MLLFHNVKVTAHLDHNDQFGKQGPFVAEQDI